MKQGLWDESTLAGISILHFSIQHCGLMYFRLTFYAYACIYLITPSSTNKVWVTHKDGKRKQVHPKSQVGPQLRLSQDFGCELWTTTGYRDPKLAGVKVINSATEMESQCSESHTNHLGISLKCSKWRIWFIRPGWMQRFCICKMCSLQYFNAFTLKTNDGHTDTVWKFGIYRTQEPHLQNSLFTF